MYAKLSILGDLALSFSVIKNTKTLFSLERDNGDIRMAHVIRFLNAVMLLVSHKCMAMFYVPYSNRTAMTELLSQKWTVVARAASLYTDPFLMLSGMLTAYSLYGKLQKSGRISLAKEYISRYFRIMPSLAFLIIFCTFILPLLSSGPQWNLVVSHHADLCKQNWWRNLLFIHNWFGFSSMCLTHTHHVGIDTELFWIAPFLIVALYKWPKRGLNVIIALAVISTIARYYVTYAYELSNYVSFGIRFVANNSLFWLRFKFTPLSSSSSSSSSV
jgi:peptidoglycan/LPS O-acetylase OafA/YrhL